MFAGFDLGVRFYVPRVIGQSLDGLNHGQQDFGSNPLKFSGFALSLQLVTCDF